MQHQIPIAAIERAAVDGHVPDGELTIDRAYPTGGMGVCAALRCSDISTPFKVIEALNSDEDTRHHASKMLGALRVHRDGDVLYYYFPDITIVGPVGPLDEKEA